MGIKHPIHTNKQLLFADISMHILVKEKALGPQCEKTCLPGLHFLIYVVKLIGVDAKSGNVPGSQN